MRSGATGQLCLQIQSIKRITYYVADTVDAAHLQIQPFSEGGNVSYELKVEKTTAGRRILFVIVLVFFCLSGWNCDIPQKSIV